MTWTSGPCEPANDETTARDRAAVAIGSLANTTNEQAEKVLDWLQAHPEVLRALAGAPTADVAAPPHSDPCSTCGGYGIVHDPGYYVPGEQFVEPPSDERCEDCVGTGMREVQERIRAAAPEGVDTADERITDLEHAALGIVANALPILRDAEKHSAWSVEAEQVVEAMDRWTDDYHAKDDQLAAAQAELVRLREQLDLARRSRDGWQQTAAQDADELSKWRRACHDLDDLLATVTAERDAAQATIHRVRALHRCEDGWPLTCEHCVGSHDNTVPYPCPTIRALDGEEGS